MSYTQKNNMDPLLILKKIVTISSISYKEQALSIWAEKFMMEQGFIVKRQKVGSKGRANLLAQRGKNPSILFYGHMDTVDSVADQTPRPWKTDPFKLEEVNGMLYGLGASDMKGGIAAFLSAAATTDVPLKILLGVDEEKDSEGAWKVVKEKKDFFDGIDLIISAEPSLGLGLNGITNARTGRCEFQINFKGDPKHIMQYKTAIDALQKVSEFGARLYENRDKMFSSSDTMAHLKSVHGEAAWMTVSGEASAIVEVFLGPGDSVKNVGNALQKLTTDKIILRPRKTPYLEGYRFANFSHRQLITNIIKEKTGKDMTLHQRTSVADDNVFATLNIPVITWGTEGGNEHKPNEYVDPKSVVKLSEMYRLFLDSLKA
jgi:succinyl-diaminopimelate desuccinylase